MKYWNNDNDVYDDDDEGDGFTFNIPLNILSHVETMVG